jgi:hypothetical protein
MRKDPLNSFTHPIFYRAFHSESGGGSSEGDLRARMDPLPDQPSSAVLKMHVDNHGWKGQKVKTPFISITLDALRAFNVAACYADERKEGVTVVVIDGWKLRDGTFEPCNELRSRLGLSKNNLFRTETLVWAEIPQQAILFRWSWRELQQSGLFNLFPRLSGKLNLKDLRNALQAEIEPLSYIQLAKVLVTGLRLPPSSLVTKQISLVMAGWRAGYAEIKYHNSLERYCSSAIDAIDAELHKKAIMTGEKGMEHARNELHGTHGAIWESTLRSYFMPEFKDWWMGREESDLGDWEMFGYQRPEPRLSFP